MRKPKKKANRHAAMLLLIDTLLTQPDKRPWLSVIDHEALHREIKKLGGIPCPAFFGVRCPEHG